jgi:hypothetical protein
MLNGGKGFTKRQVLQVTGSTASVKFEATSAARVVPVILASVERKSRILEQLVGCRAEHIPVLVDPSE